MRGELLLEQVGEVVEGAGVAGLAEPEDGLLTDGGVFAGSGYLDELGGRFGLGKTGEGEDRRFANLGVGIVFGEDAEIAGDHLAAFGRHPELGLPADLRRGVFVGHADEFLDRVGIVADVEIEGDLLAKGGVRVIAGEVLKGCEARVAILGCEPEGPYFWSLFARLPEQSHHAFVSSHRRRLF